MKDGIDSKGVAIISSKALQEYLYKTLPSQYHEQINQLVDLQQAGASEYKSRQKYSWDKPKKVVLNPYQGGYGAVPKSYNLPSAEDTEKFLTERDRKRTAGILSGVSLGGLVTKVGVESYDSIDRSLGGAGLSQETKDKTIILGGEIASAVGAGITGKTAVTGKVVSNKIPKTHVKKPKRNPVDTELDNTPKSTKVNTPTKLCVDFCFTAGTLIHTVHGLRPIETIQHGDMIWSREEFGTEYGYRPVIATKETPDVPVYEVIIKHDNGLEETFKTTEEHPFYVDGEGWRKASILEAGM